MPFLGSFSASLCSYTSYTFTTSTSQLSDRQLISSITNDDVIVAYEIDPYDDTSKIHAVLTHSIADENTVSFTTTDRKLFGLPLLISFDSTFTCAEVFDKLWSSVKAFVMIGKKEMSNSCSIENVLKFRLRVHVTDVEGNLLTFSTENKKVDSTFSSKVVDQNSAATLSPTCHERLLDLIGIEYTDKFVFFALEWIDVTFDAAHISREGNNSESTQIHCSNFHTVINHSSYLQYQQRARRFNGANAVTLDQCFESFTQPGKLSFEQ